MIHQTIHYKGLRLHILHLHSPSLQVQLRQRWVSRVGRIGARSNLRSGALAVRVIAGLVDEDFNVQLLSAGVGEYERKRERVGSP